jgi:hypothetical protein
MGGFDPRHRRSGNQLLWLAKQRRQAVAVDQLNIAASRKRGRILSESTRCDDIAAGGV